MIRSPGTARVARLLLVATLLAGCAPTTPQPSPSPSPSAALVDPAAEAAHVVARMFVAQWRARRYDAMVELLAPQDRERYLPDRITGLLRQFDELSEVIRVEVATGKPIRSSAPADGTAQGPVPAYEVPLSLTFETVRFGTVTIHPTLLLTEGPKGWQARWSPSLLFPALRNGDSLALLRIPAPRGRIVGRNASSASNTRS